MESCQICPSLIGFFSLSIMSSQFTRVVAYNRIAFLFKQYSIVWIHHLFFIQLPADERVADFHLLE